jgi:2-polyprenyl-6-methoxyphenol hydroxylase-like FAD-dependent oxidoreductase
LRCSVIGAGVGGLSAALSLHEVGLDVDVFEATQQIQPLGVGINLLPHAVRELDSLGLLDALRDRSVAPASLVYCTRRGQEIWREPRGLAAGYRWQQISVHRGVLQEVLLEAVLDRLGPAALHLGCRLVEVAGSKSRPRVVFEGGASEADLVVGADGIHSAVRAQHYPHEGPPLWGGTLLWRGLAEVDRVLDGRTMIWCGHPEQKFIAYPVADPPGRRQSLNFVAELRRPNSDLARSEDWNRIGSLEDFLPEFEGWRFEWLDVPATIGAAPATYLFPMVDRDPLPGWTFGRTTLLGDAAHPMYPIGSNGASQAILDGRVLAGCLRHPVGDPGQALLRYEQVRRSATSATIQANRSLGPELPMLLVEQRAPDGFSDISAVISPQEIAEVTEEYRRTAGFAIADLSRTRSLIEEPYPA